MVYHGTWYSNYCCTVYVLHPKVVSRYEFVSFKLILHHQSTESVNQLATWAMQQQVKRVCGLPQTKTVCF